MHCDHVGAVCTRSPLRDMLARAYHRLVIMRVYARYMRGKRNNVRKIDILV